MKQAECQFGSLLLVTVMTILPSMGLSQSCEWHLVGGDTIKWEDEKTVILAVCNISEESQEYSHGAGSDSRTWTITFDSEKEADILCSHPVPWDSLLEPTATRILTAVWSAGEVTVASDMCVEKFVLWRNKNFGQIWDSKYQEEVIDNDIARWGAGCYEYEIKIVFYEIPNPPEEPAPPPART